MGCSWWVTSTSYMVNSKEVMDLCLDGINNPSYEPRDGRTFCNLFTSSVAIALGYRKFVGLLANDMIAHMDLSTSWKGIKMEKASKDAMDSFIIAGKVANKHGHVCVVLPGKTVYSKNWDKKCPIVASIGKKDKEGQWAFIKGVNFAFKDEPRFWKWLE